MEMRDHGVLTLVETPVAEREDSEAGQRGSPARDLEAAPAREEEPALDQLASSAELGIRRDRAGERVAGLSPRRPEFPHPTDVLR